MSDIENSVTTDGVGIDENVSADAGAVPEPEVTEPDETGADGVIDDGKEAAYAPVTKFKFGSFNKEKNEFEQKEQDIDPRFHSIMADAEAEKLVRELHEKAFGLDGVKERLFETRQAHQDVMKENTEIKSSIEGLRETYRDAVSTGNYLKLDNFFDKLQIPADVVLKYAYQKVKLSEAPVEQQQLYMSQMEQEKRAGLLEQQRQQAMEQTANQAQQLKGLQLEVSLGRDDLKPLVQEFDERAGRAGAFRELVAQAGQLAWLQSNGTVDLTPDQAIQQVIASIGLKPSSAPQNGAIDASGKRVIQRTPNTIPNVQGRSSSPLKSKPKNLEELKKLAQSMAQSG